MPCTCWYDPPEEDKKIIKDLCVQLVDKVKELNKSKDAYGYEINDIHKLIDHLWNPKSCTENPSNKEQINA